MSELDSILSDFEADVERAEHLLAFIKSFREFGASIPPQRDITELDSWPAATSLHNASKQRRTDLPILSGSLQLYLAGRFEYCLRRMVEVVADELAARASRYTDLPEAMRTALKKQTLEVWQKPTRYGYDDVQLDALLADLVASKACAAPPVPVTSSVLSITDSNLKADALANLVKRVGIVEFWREVGKQAPMKILLEKASDSETTAEAQSRLNAIMEERNQVAHPTSGTVFPDPDQVQKAAQFLKTLAVTTVDLAKVSLAAYKPSKAVP
jgi:hypothetical protein